jgi:hypothetical protein
LTSTTALRATVPWVKGGSLRKDMEGCRRNGGKAAIIDSATSTNDVF